jgi:hypothetical protein
MLQNNLFDHKAILLTLRDPVRQPMKKVFRIRNNLLDVDILQIRVELAVAEAYLLHLEPGQLTREDIATKLRKVGELKGQSLLVPYPYRYWPEGYYADADILNRAILMENLRFETNRIGIPQLFGLEKNVNCLLFMETLLIAVKNEIISFQSHFLKWKNSTINSLQNELKELKKNYDENFERIARVETKLNSIFDADAKKELDNYAMFEVVNMEKMTPAFLAIAKNTRRDASLSDLRDDNDAVFRTGKERDDYIVNYFKNIYSIKPDTDTGLRGCIERFLGPEILNIPEVVNSKITGEQQLILDRDIEINELDLAIKKMKSKSVGGPDGIGVPVYKKFWPFLRHALLNYCSEMMRTENLSPSFLTSSIRLIPKKGDNSKIKNWRPISLLNVGYKIISKAINNRLKKVSNRILARPQKGFSANRNIQECLINIIETVAFCQKSKTKAFMLAIDQAKAFDTVSHEFVQEVYKFFGFGDRFINMLNITTMGRNATIILENDNLSASFPLRTGFQQGNGPSPLQFNFCEQILIFKLEYDPNIRCISWVPNNINAQVDPAQRPPHPQQIRHQQGPAAAQPAVPAVPGADPAADPPITPPAAEARLAQQARPAAQEVQQPVQQGKVESFADDATVLALADRAAILQIKLILENFAKISGLKANIDKCVLVPIGFDNDIPDYFYEAGFQIDNSVKILGCTVYNDTNKIGENFNETISQLIKVKNFWSRFNLSIPGRIAIAKTLMLSKLSYLGCMLDPDPVQLAEINNVIINFIRGKLNISVERITSPPDRGGLGMINIDDFLTGLKIAWVRRAKQINDMWSTAINCYEITRRDLGTGSENTMIISNIHKAFLKLKTAVILHKHNILVSPVVNNPVLNLAGVQSINLDNVPVPVPLRRRIENLTFSDLIINNSPFSRARIATEFEGLRQEDVEKLFLALRYVVRFLKADLDPDPADAPKTVDEIICKIKKGSKFYRSFLTKKRMGDKILNLNSVRKFFFSIGLATPDPIQIREINAFWTTNYLPNKFKEFHFKFHNNLIGLNSRVSHFNQYINPECTFCTKRKWLPAQRETLRHLFYDCPEVNPIYLYFFRVIAPSLQTLNDDEKLTLWFGGSVKNKKHVDNVILNLLLRLSVFYIWENKLKKNYLSIASYVTFLRENIRVMANISNNLNICISNASWLFCRNGEQE